MNRKPNRVKIYSLQNMLVSEKKEKSAILSFKVWDLQVQRAVKKGLQNKAR